MNTQSQNLFCDMNGDFDGSNSLVCTACTQQTGCASANAPGTPCSTSAGYTDKQTCSLADDEFYLDADIVKPCEAIADTVTYTCDGPSNSRAQCKIGFFITDNSNLGISDTCTAQATCGDKDQSGNANAVTDADCGTGFEYNPDAASLHCLGAACNIVHNDPVDGDKSICCKAVGTVANIVVKVTASIALAGVSKAEMETDVAKADFAEGVASNINGVSASEIKNIVVTEIFTDRRRLNEALAKTRSRRLQAATGVQVTFDIEIDTISAQNAGVGDGTATGLFSAVASELATAVSSGSVVTALNSQSSFSGLDASYTNSNYDSNAVTYSAASVATLTPTPGSSLCSLPVRRCRSTPARPLLTLRPSLSFDQGRRQGRRQRRRLTRRQVTLPRLFRDGNTTRSDILTPLPPSRGTRELRAVQEPVLTVQSMRRSAPYPSCA